jgi:hypothetical protein
MILFCFEFLNNLFKIILKNIYIWIISFTLRLLNPRQKQRESEGEKWF